MGSDIGFPLGISIWIVGNGTAIIYIYIYIYIHIYIYGYKDRKALHKLMSNAVYSKQKEKKWEPELM